MMRRPKEVPMRRLLFLLLLPLAARAAEPDPALTVVGGGAERALPRSRLLAEARDVTVPDPHGAATYRAVPFAQVVAGLQVPPDASFKFVATDGFVAVIPASRLLGPAAEKAGPWIAIEPPGRPWPQKHPGVTGGPFALVWAHPEAEGVTSEEWPYAVARIELGEPLEKRYPGLVPAASASAEARRGFQVFATSCLPCHALDGQGEARIGPDLNRPMNPTEYFRPEVLPKYIRDPRSVRTWPTAVMPAQPLDDRQIADVIAYLAYMAARKTR
jgi:mono/diheme cytochrome c family protein